MPDEPLVEPYRERVQTHNAFVYGQPRGYTPKCGNWPGGWWGGRGLRKHPPAIHYNEKGDQLCTGHLKYSNGQTPCPNYPIKGNHVCKNHGGKLLKGLASPRFTTGKHSRYLQILPEARRSDFLDLLEHPQLVGLNQEIAMTQLRLVELYARVATGESGEAWLQLYRAVKGYKKARDGKSDARDFMMKQEWATIETLTTKARTDYECYREIDRTKEHLRKLVETQSKIRLQESTTQTQEQATFNMRLVATALQRHVTDPAILSALSMELKQIATQGVVFLDSPREDASREVVVDAEYRVEDTEPEIEREPLTPEELAAEYDDSSDCFGDQE